MWAGFRYAIFGALNWYWERLAPKIVKLTFALMWGGRCKRCGYAIYPGGWKPDILDGKNFHHECLTAMERQKSISNERYS